MIPGKSSAIVSVAAILLSAAGAPAKLRGSARDSIQDLGSIRMGMLLAQNGLPFYAIDAIARLSPLSKVDVSSCSSDSSNGRIGTPRGTAANSPRGSAACYLIDPSEENLAANEAAWRTMDENSAGQALVWFGLLQDAGGRANLSQVAARTLGVTVDGLTNVNEDEYKRAVGAAHRSLLDEAFKQEECDTVTDFLDKNEDGMLTVAEITGGMNEGGCSEQAGGATQFLCDFYVKALSEYVGQQGLTLDRFCGWLVGTPPYLLDDGSHFARMTFWNTIASNRAF